MPSPSAGVKPINARFSLVPGISINCGVACSVNSSVLLPTPRKPLFSRRIFSAIGVAVVVDDKHIDAVTALAGSGPAFVYTVIEALAAGGVQEGLAPEVALTLATNTVLGAAQLAAESDSSPDELRRMVITPGGTTAAGLAAMEKHGTSEGLVAAVVAAARRGAEMAAGELSR